MRSSTTGVGKAIVFDLACDAAGLVLCCGFDSHDPNAAFQCLFPFFAARIMRRDFQYAQKPLARREFRPGEAVKPATAQVLCRTLGNFRRPVPKQQDRPMHPGPHPSPALGLTVYRRFPTLVQAGIPRKQFEWVGGHIFKYYPRLHVLCHRHRNPKLGKKSQNTTIFVTVAGSPRGTREPSDQWF